MRIRRMEDRDVADVNAVAAAAFTDLNDRMGDPPYVPSSPDAAAIRLRRLLATDPDGAWVAEHDGIVLGAAIALVRERLWALSLFVVDPDAQSAGIGRALLDRAWAYGERADGHAILASRDPRALRAYTRLGLDLHPALDARGRARAVAMPDGIRPWREGDHAWADEVGRAVRGAAHGADIDALLAAGSTVTVVPGEGYAAARGGGLRLLVASTDAAGRTLLDAHLAAAGEETVSVQWITSAQQWAIRACVDAGLDLCAHGAVMTGGRLGTMSPFLPSGAYL
jgi:GNAT superfamily N-acetyltransferase